MTLRCLIVDNSPRFLDAARGLLERISTHAEQDYTDLTAASPVVGFLSKSALSVDAIRALITSRGDGQPVDPVSETRGR
jgi:hypothetical protein